MEKGDFRWLVSTALVLLGLLVAALTVLWAFGLLDSTDKSGGGPAALALVGVMITASVSVIGLLFKRQSDRRLEVERAASEQRLGLARREESQRLRLDAAMRAGALLTPGPSGPPDAAAMASGLLALTQLDQSNLAVALLVDLWSETRESQPVTERAPENGEAASPSSDTPQVATPRSAEIVSDESAILVLDAALRSGKPNAELVAAELLCRNAWRLDACQSLHWPSSIDGEWIPGLGNKTKLLLMDALIRMTYTSIPNENALRSLAVRLYAISEIDPSDRVKGCVGQVLTSILPKLVEFGNTEFMHGPQTVTLKELQCAADKATPNPDGMLEKILADRSEALREWSERCETTSLHTGALGNCEFPSLRDFQATTS